MTKSEIRPTSELKIGWSDKHSLIAYLYNRYRKRYLRVNSNLVNNILYLFQESLGLNSMKYDFILKHDRGVVSYEVDNDLKVMEVRYLIKVDESGNIQPEEDFDQFLSMDEVKRFLAHPLIAESLEAFDREFAGLSEKDMARRAALVRHYKTRDKATKDSEALRFIKRTTFWENRPQSELEDTFNHLKEQGYIR